VAHCPIEVGPASPLPFVLLVDIEVTLLRIPNLHLVGVRGGDVAAHAHVRGAGRGRHVAVSLGII